MRQVGRVLRGVARAAGQVGLAHQHDHRDGREGHPHHQVKIVDISDQNKTYLLPDQTNPQPKDFQLTSHSAFAGIDLKAKIKIKSAKYYNGDLSNISLNFVTENGNFLLKPLSAEIPGNGILTMNGSLERDNDIPKFIGKIEISGQNLQKSLAWLGIEPKNLKPNILTEYALSSDLLILPNFNIFNNLSLAINNSTNIVVGNLKIDDSLGISKSTANLRFNYLKYDDYFLDIGQSPYLSSGSLLKKLLWLNVCSRFAFYRF